MSEVETREVLAVEAALEYANRAARMSSMRQGAMMDLSESEDIAQDALVLALSEDPAVGLTREYLAGAVARLWQSRKRDFARALRIAGTDDAPEGRYTLVDIDMEAGEDGETLAAFVPGGTDFASEYLARQDALAADADDVRTWQGPDGSLWTADPGWDPAGIAASGIAIPVLRAQYHATQAYTPTVTVRGETVGPRGEANTERMMGAAASDFDAHVLDTLALPADHTDCGWTGTDWQGKAAKCGKSAGAIRIARMRAKSRAAGSAGADVAE